VGYTSGMHSLEDAIPVHRAEDNEHLGYIAEQPEGWLALTIFGCPFAISPSENEARHTVESKGLEILTAPWEYYDKAESAWQRCIIVEAAPTYVRVAPMDGPYPDTTRTFLVKNPAESNLRVLH
jgi:hypothetical protein